MSNFSGQPQFETFLSFIRPNINSKAILYFSVSRCLVDFNKRMVLDGLDFENALQYMYLFPASISHLHITTLGITQCIPTFLLNNEFSKSKSDVNPNGLPCCPFQAIRRNQETGGSGKSYNISCFVSILNCHTNYI